MESKRVGNDKRGIIIFLRGVTTAFSGFCCGERGDRIIVQEYINNKANKGIVQIWCAFMQWLIVKYDFFYQVQIKYQIIFFLSLKK